MKLHASIATPLPRTQYQKQQTKFRKKNSNEPKNLKIKDNHVEIILWMTFILNFF